MEIFIPITGRSGSARNPDVLISIICCVTTLFICSYMVSIKLGKVGVDFEAFFFIIRSL